MERMGEVIKPYYPTGKCDRPPIDLELVLQIKLVAMLAYLVRSRRGRCYLQQLYHAEVYGD